jgi:hypothetical protein
MGSGRSAGVEASSWVEAVESSDKVEAECGSFAELGVFELVRLETTGLAMAHMC